MLPAEQLFAPFENSVLGIVPEPDRMDELHLYHGARCNRTCNFCCVNGSPDGDHHPFEKETLRAAVSLVGRRGSLKIYGGEPTLDARALRCAIGGLRAVGFEGAITLFSNGLRPRVLVDMLESDDRTFVVLNRAIATGEGELPIPSRSLAVLASFEAADPGRIFLSHDFAVPVGRQLAADGRAARAEARCYRCWPALTSSGRFHACPFAVAYDYPHYRLGTVDDRSDDVLGRFHAFKEWIALQVEPRAQCLGVHPCEVCCRPTVDGSPEI